MKKMMPSKRRKQKEGPNNSSRKPRKGRVPKEENFKERQIEKNLTSYERLIRGATKSAHTVQQRSPNRARERGGRGKERITNFSI